MRLGLRRPWGVLLGALVALASARPGWAQTETSTASPGASAAEPTDVAEAETSTAAEALPRPEAGSSASSLGLGEVHLEFQGNVVLIPEVYRSVLHYAGWDRAPSNPVDRAGWIEQTLEDFLHASGYELATVVVLPDGRGWEVLIDEGRLDKIIFRNVDPWTTVQLIFLLDLPEKVFNRDILERRLDRVREKMSIDRIDYEVVPVDEPEHERLQIGAPQIIEGLTLLSPGEPHELRISFGPPDERLGLALGFGFQPPDGLTVEGSHLASSVLVRRDRLETFGRVGVRVTDIGRIPGNRLGLSRAGGGLLWSTPSVFDILRFTARGEVNLEARRREDLRIVNYFFAPVELALGFSLEGDGVVFSAAGGAAQRSFFGAREEEDETAPVLAITEGSNLRTFAESELVVTFNPSRLRRDRPHDVTLGGRYLWPLSSAEGEIVELELEYQNTLTVGFDELRYALRGEWLDGQVPFYSERAMGEGLLRSAFQGTVWVQRAVALDLEYRFSLSRDELKLGLFNDVVVYESLDELRDSRGLRAIDNFGVGLHVLLLDAFQVNAYVGAGLRTDGEIDLGFSLDVDQAF